MTFRLNNYFQKREDFRLNVRDAFSFIVLEVIVWAMNSVAQMIFPAQNLLPFFVRTAISAAGTLILILISIRLLKKSNVAADALELKLSKNSLSGFILGAVIAVIVMVISGATLYIFVPYHFIGGPLKTAEAIKEAHSFLWGNFTEDSISGLDGLARSVFTPVFETRWPVYYDPGLLSFEISAITMALLLYLLINSVRPRALPNSQYNISE